MFGLPKDVDLNFFIGKALQQVCIGANEVNFNFDDNVRVMITCPVGCALAKDVLELYEDYKMAASSMVLFLQKVVTQVKPQTDGTLDLIFEDGSYLQFYDDTPHYEAYTIHNGDKIIVV